MYNEEMYGLGSKRSAIREIFEYAKTRSAQIGKENVFDFSIGNPSVPAPACVHATIKKLLEEVKNIQNEIDVEVKSFMDDYKFQTNEAISFSEIEIEDNSWVINKTLGELNFWNYTEATVVAIKRVDGTLITSPGPDMPLFKKDKLIFVCKDNLSYERVVAFLEYGIEDDQ